jgi:SAM-dependent methyltransferase
VWRELALACLPASLDGLTALDCGSARGGFSRALALRGARVTAVDSSSVAVELTQRLLDEGGEAVVADARRLPFGDATFDIVTCLQTLNYVGEWRDVVRELVRVAKPGAPLVVTVLNYRSPLGVSRALQARLGREVRAPGELGRSTGAVLAELRSAGVDVDAVSGDGHALAIPGLRTIGLAWLARLPRTERFAFHVCIAGRVRG